MSEKILEFSHAPCNYTCTANGLRDVYMHKTGHYVPGEFMMVFSGFADFVYLKSKRAPLPFMVFWARSVKEHYKGLEHIFGFRINIKAGRSFPFALNLVKKEIDKGNPIIVGPLDMFHLEYRSDLFHKKHTFAHFVLVVGYDDRREYVYVYDCDLHGRQKLSYENLKLAWGKDEPGYLKRNAVITFSLPEKTPDFKEIVRRGLLFKAEQMLNPNTKNFGILGMRKLAKEFPSWEHHLNEKNYKMALEWMATFSNTPPILTEEIDNFTAKRKELSNTIKELAELTPYHFLNDIAQNFAESGEIIRSIAHTIINWLKHKEDRREEIPTLLEEIANIEEKTYSDIKRFLSISVS